MYTADISVSFNSTVLTSDSNWGWSKLIVVIVHCLKQSTIPYEANIYGILTIVRHGTKHWQHKNYKT